MGQEFITRLNDGSIDSQMLISLLDMGAKGLLLMTAAGLAAAAMRKHAAAARHLVWLLALSGLLLLPVVSVLMPKWTLPILPATQAPTTQEVAPISPPVAESDLSAMVQAPSAPIAPPVTSVAQPTLPPAPPSLPMTISPASSLKTISYPAWLLAIWLAVALLSLSPFAAGVVAVTRMRRRAESFADPEIQSLATTLAQTMGLKGTPRLLRGPIGAMPMATGFFTPAVFLPADALDWPEEKQRAVLLHELAHVRRRDCLTHALARVATSLHWFNPLAWLALRQLRIEREHACDDLVLAAGERPSAYAENLLEIARTLHAKSVVSAAAITMAQKSQLEGRLLAVLDAARNRGRVTKTLFAASALCAITALALLASVNVARSESKGARAESSASNFELQYESGFTATLIGVTAGNTQHPDVAWEPGGTLLPTAPGPNAGVEFDVLEKGKVGRNFYMRIQADTDEQSTADFGVKFRVAPTDGGSLLSNGGPRTAPIFSTDFNEGLSTHRFELGIASGAWKSVAKSTFGKPTAGKVGDSDYVLLTTETYTRNGETRFSVTHSVKDREWRIVLNDKKNTMHKPIQNLSNGVNGMTQTEFTLRDIAPEEVERIELQVRDYEWKKFEGIAVNPNTVSAANTSAEVAQSSALEVESLERLDPTPDGLPPYSTRFSDGVVATVQSVGEPDEQTTVRAWSPAGDLMTIEPLLVDNYFGEKTLLPGLQRRRIRVQFSQPELLTESTLRFRVNGHWGGGIPHQNPDSTIYIVQTDVPDRALGDFEMGIASEPWTTSFDIDFPVEDATNSPTAHPWRFEEDEYQTKVVIDSVELDNDYRLYVTGHDGTVYHEMASLTASGEGGGRVEYHLRYGDTSKNIKGLQFLVRDMEWRTIPGLALHPSSSTPEDAALAEEIRRKRLEPDYHDHELTWGPAIQGYQCAWRITRPKDHYAIGETIPTEIVVRNTHSTTKMLTIQTSALGQGGTVYRADGSTVPLTREKLRSRPGGLGREIPPGESVAVHGPTLVMLDADTAEATVYAGALIAHAGQGELEVALNVRLTQFPHEASSTPGEYMMETFQTGKVKLNIQEADGG